MYSKRLALITALMAPSFNLISMTRQDLLALHASLTALNQSIPASSSSAAPASATETKAAAEIIALVNDAQIDPILKTIASELSKKKEAMTEESWKQNISKPTLALGSMYREALGQNNAQLLQKIQQALFNVYQALKAIPKDISHRDPMALQNAIISLKSSEGGLAEDGFDTTDLNDKYIMVSLNGRAEGASRLNETFEKISVVDRQTLLGNWKKAKNDLENLIKSNAFNSNPAFKNALAKAKEVLAQLDAVLPQLIQKAGGSEAKAGAETKLVGEASVLVKTGDVKTDELLAKIAAAIEKPESAPDFLKNAQYHFRPIVINAMIDNKKELLENLPKAIYQLYQQAMSKKLTELTKEMDALGLNKDAITNAFMDSYLSEHERSLSFWETKDWTKSKSSEVYGYKLNQEKILKLISQLIDSPYFKEHFASYDARAIKIRERNEKLVEKLEGRAAKKAGEEALAHLSWASA